MEKPSNRREFLEQMAAFGFASGVTGITILPGIASAQQKGKYGGTLVMVVAPEPPNLATFLSTANPASTMGTKVYEGLLEYDFSLKPIPGLAKSWQLSADGRTITFKLQEGVTFHDGKPFTSADVQFSVMEVLKKVHPRGPNTFAAVTAVETPDPLTAVFRLSEPAPYIMSALSGYESPMVPKHLLSIGDLKTHPLLNKPVGTGPFTFGEWKRGEYIRLDRNKNYWKKGRPYLDRLVARFIDSTQTRAAAMQAGEVQFSGFNSIPFSDVKRLRAIPGITAVSKGYEMISPIVQLEINTTRGPMKSEKVRQAIAYGIDRKFVIDNIWFGYGKPATGPISSNFKATGMYSPDVRKYDVPNRIELANKLLDEAGFPRKADGVRFEMVHDMIPFGDEWKRFGEYVKQALGSLGIQVTLRYEDFPTWLRRIFTEYDFDMTSDVIFTLSDPVIGVHRLYSSWNIRPGTIFVNDSRWSSPRTDEIMKAASVENDPKKRNALYHELQKLLTEAVPIVWVNELDWVNIYHTKFQDLIVSPLGVCAAFDQAWLKA